MRPGVALGAVVRDLRGLETTPRPDREHLDRAIGWLYRSQDVTDCDGSAAYYSLLTGWAGPYPETSGYIVQTLYDYASFAGSREAAERARRMGTWLLTVQRESGAFPGGVDPGSGAEPSVFNTGQILFGLVRSYRETGEERFLTAAEAAAAWLVGVQHPEGYWDRFDYRGEIHSYCSRVAWALLETAVASETARFQEAAVDHLEWVRSTQTDRDWFEYAAFSPDERPYLHTIAYTVRGLLEGGVHLDDEELIAVARATADRLLEARRANGPLLGAYDRDWTGSDFYCLTGNAQVALIWLRLYERTGAESYLDAAADEIEFLKRQHTVSGHSAVRGALRGSDPVWGRYMRLRYPNWAAKFFCDAVMLKSRLIGRDDL